MNVAVRSTWQNTRTIELVSNQRLRIEHRQAADTLSIVDPDGRITLSIRVTADGPVLLFEGTRLNIQADGILCIDADHVAIRGRETLSLSSGGDAEIRVAGD